VVSGDTQIRVLVASQAPIYLYGIRRALDSRREFRVVGESSRASDVLLKVRRLEPDVAIVDAAMPDFDAGQVIRAIARDGLTTGLVVLSAEPVRRPLVGGPAAYVPATADASAICDAVAAAARGESPRFEAWDVRLPASGDPPRALSSRELAVLELTADGRSAAAIGRDLNVSEATVKTHLRHIYRKLGVSDRAAAVAEGLRRGLIE
jgi:two-component system nitrate/nitrite response regulator NarL